MEDLEQEVTVEVIPQTVTKIIYLSEDVEADADKTDSNDRIPWDEEDCEEPSDDQLYEIGSVDIDDNNQYTINRQLILDETQSYVLLSQDGIEELGNMREYINLNTVYLDNVDETNEPINFVLPHESSHDSDQDKHKSNSIDSSQKLVQAIIQNNNCTEVPLPFIPQTKTTKFTCDKCGIVLNNGVDLLEHKKSHGTTMLYACNKCDAEFSSTAEVSTHLRMQHSKKKVENLVLSRPLKYVPVQKRHFMLSGKSSGKNGNVTKKCRKK